MIKVIGIGTCGCNAIVKLLRSKRPGIEYIAMNSNRSKLPQIEGVQSLLLGEKILRGNGANKNRTAGQQAAEASKANINAALAGADVIFVISGFAGGTGAGCLPVILECAKKSGAACICLGILPYAFEGKERRDNAQWAVDLVKRMSVAYMTVDNEAALFSGEIERNTPLSDAFDELGEDFAKLITATARIQENKPDEIRLFSGGRRLSISSVQAAPDRISAMPTEALMLGHQGSSALLVQLACGFDVPRSLARRAFEWAQKLVIPDVELFPFACRDEKLGEEVDVTLIGFHDR